MMMENAGGLLLSAIFLNNFRFYHYLINKIKRKEMSQAKNKTIHDDSTETRYQKALKEITKLINLNNQLKNQAKRKDHEMNDLILQNTHLSDSLKKVSLEKQLLKAQLDDVANKYKDISDDMYENETKRRKKKEELFQKLFNDSNLQNVRGSGDSTIYMRRIQELEEKIRSLNNKISEMERINEDKMKQLKLQNLNLKDKVRSTEQTCLQLKNFNHRKRNKFSQQKLNNLKKQELIDKIKIAQYWNQNTSNECVELKKKILRYESQNKIFLRAKSQQNLPTFNVPQSDVHSKSPHKTGEIASLSHFQLMRKMKGLEEERKSISKKYEAMKVRLETIDSQFTIIVKENDKNQKMIDGYEKLIEKQQKEIQNLVNEYEQDMKKATQQFKGRLKEQRENFGSSKAGKYLKTIESLQVQNKSLKKKANLCSNQVTKCFKMLKAYEAKTKEYENQCNNLIMANQVLTEKLSSKETSEKKVRSNIQFNMDQQVQIKNHEDNKLKRKNNLGFANERKSKFK